MDKAIITSGAVRGDMQALINEMVARGMDSEKRMRMTAGQLAEAARPLTEEEQLYYDLLASGMSTREAKRKLARMAKRKKK